jgi:hypothetical protein
MADQTCTECGVVTKTLFVGASGHHRCETCYLSANPAVTGRKVLVKERPAVEDTLRYDDYGLAAKVAAYLDKE